ncbi:hypothetical protein EPUL_002712 [Erysiphe pulchra]|uniref:Symplekin/Pta1 N-terminal domain-containing protein n=1 Tax=Erysiphe pulchra TaxID=225359 RepID=A0A2S4PRY0_9PEZI|nr:hypothetical protein EPUL_002712 [Erysiphe pulchra]
MAILLFLKVVDLILPQRKALDLVESIKIVLTIKAPTFEVVTGEYINKPLVAALTRSVAKVNTVVKKLAAVRGEQALAPQSENPSPPTMNIDTVSELNPELESDSGSDIDEFPPLPSDYTLKRTSKTLSPTQGGDTQDFLKDDQRSQNSTLMLKARGLLNLVRPYLEEMETNCPGAGAEFLALISEGVSRAIRGETIFSRT